MAPNLSRRPIISEIFRLPGSTRPHESLGFKAPFGQAELDVPLNEYFLDFDAQHVKITIDRLDTGKVPTPREVVEGTIAVEEGERCTFNGKPVNDLFKPYENARVRIWVRPTWISQARKHPDPVPSLAHPEMTLWYAQPAGTWNEALPIGNGHFGGMVFGDTTQERLQLNEDTVWYGGFLDRVNPDARDHLPRVRELLLAGKFTEAARLTEMALYALPPTQRPYQKFCDLRLLYEGAMGAGKVTEYHRELDLDTGVARVAYSRDEMHFTREYLASAVDDVVAVRLAGSEPGSVNFRARLERTFHGDNSLLDPGGRVGSDEVFLHGQSGPDGVTYRAALKTVVEGGSVEALGDHLVVTGADAATLYLAAATSFRHDVAALPDVVSGLVSRAAAKGFARVKEAHVADHRALFRRVSFWLAPRQEYKKFVPTDVRLRRLAKDEDDLGLVTLYFQYGRYLLMACSRPGSMPANLQGLWCDQFLPSWGSKYTININTEMNYWPAEVCNLSECHAPLFDHLARMRPRGEAVARAMYGCEGWVAHHNTNLWGDCAPVDRWPGCIWPMGAAWLCTHLWEHYAFTRDETFLREQAYPIMKGAARFFLDFLVEGPDGTLLCGPSISPEMAFLTPEGGRAYQTMGATMDRQILHDLFTECARCGEILGVDAEFRERLLAARERLPPLQVGRHGQLQEWRADHEDAEPGHRHMSHLWGLHPGYQISVEKTPELAEAAKTALHRRLKYGGGHTGWSCAWIINFWARLHEANFAADYVRAILTQSTLPNLLDDHPPFQIDGNFGATAGIAEMLLQSHQDQIRLLPCLPTAWPTGHVTGLRARGNYDVSIWWEDGELVRAEITPRSPGTCCLHTNKPVKVSHGDAQVRIRYKELLVVEFPVTAGETYLVETR